MKILIPYLIAIAACWSGFAAAQTTVAKPATATAAAPVMLDLHAFGTNGEKFTEDRIRGKVAIVFYWSTSCAVCRDSLPELRMNLNGWRE
jgi:cytochrome oxidase Cu insertion factor (SCO1/SenC/PrrC family)